MINDILLEVQAAFRDCVDIQVKYGTVVHQEPPTPINDRQQKMPRDKSLLHRVFAVSGKPARATSRLQWALVKKDSFKLLIDKLIAFNDRMEAFLDRNSLEQVHSLQVQSNMMLLHVTNEVSELRVLFEALNITREPWSNAGSGKNGPATPGHLETTIATLAQFKAEAVIFQRAVMQQTPTLINFGDLKLIDFDSVESRAFGRYRNDHVWLEWRKQVEERPSVRIQRITEQRVMQLTALLCCKDKPAIFRSPRCLGYVRDDSEGAPQYALVYHAGHSSESEQTKAIDLRAMFTTMSTPSLGTRLALASALADSVFYLHAVSWLHKGIRSDNVVFIETSERPGPNDDKKGVNRVSANILSSPLLSGFDYSRPDLIDENTFHNVRRPADDLYCHPDLLQMKAKRSRKAHDIYSLGIVLIEIAFWRPIESVLDVEVRRSRLLDIGHKLAKLNETDSALRSRLAARVGDGYVRAVNACVNNDDGLSSPPGAEETDPSVTSEKQKIFFEQVVEELHKIRV